MENTIFLHQCKINFTIPTSFFDDTAKRFISFIIQQIQRMQPMIDVKQAVRVAMAFVADLYENKNLYDLLLEEVRLSEDQRYWLITVGFSRNPGLGGILGGMNTDQRTYKVIKINAENGEPKEMTMRLS